MIGMNLIRLTSHTTDCTCGRRCALEEREYKRDEKFTGKEALLIFMLGLTCGCVMTALSWYTVLGGTP